MKCALYTGCYVQRTICSEAHFRSERYLYLGHLRCIYMTMHVDRVGLFAHKELAYATVNVPPTFTAVPSSEMSKASMQL